MLITYNETRKRFEAQFAFGPDFTASKDAVKAAGFAFDSNAKPIKVWHTAGYRNDKLMPEQARIAAKLIAYCDGSAKSQMCLHLEAIEEVAKQVEQIDLVAAQAVKTAALDASRALDSDRQIPVPNGLSYLPYQRAGIAYAMDRQHALIGDEMGLGKTIQGIGISNADPSVRSVLVICPASLKLNWKREWKKWDVKALSVAVGGSKHLPDSDVVIVNFDVIKKQHKKLIARNWDLVIIDECHKVKNPDAQRTQFILGRAEKRNKDGEIKKPAIEGIPAKRQIFLTGTPILNRPIELWTLVEKLDPTGLGKNFWSFAKRYCNATQDRFGWNFNGASHLDELQDRLRAAFMVRRLKSEVLKDLPAKRRQVILIEPDVKGRELIEKEKVAYEHFQANEGDSVALSEMSRLRHEVAIYKVPFVADHVEDLLETLDKVIVFAHHKDVVDALMAKFGDAAVKIDGRVTDMQVRQDAVDRFQTDAACKVFVGSIQAAGVGLTLTAASTVVFAELDWVPGNVTQAEDRVHRIGQTQQVLIQHIILDESLDATMINKIMVKQAVIDAALDSKSTKEVDEVKMPAVGIAPKPEVNTVTIRSRKGPEEITLTPAQIEAIHACLKRLRGSCNGARDWDGAGFSKTDVQFGWQLADSPRLSLKQAAYGQRMVRKYQKQLGHAMVAACGVEPKDSKSLRIGRY